MALTRITKGVIKPNENYDTHNIVSTGIVTAVGLDINGNADISGNFSVGGVLTYEDVTSIDSVGIITAQKDIHVGAGISVVGVSTFSEDIIVNGLTVGKGASSGNQNTVLGAGAFDRTGIGAQNTAIGNNALTNNQNGSGNTVVGHDAAFSNVNGLSNTAVGRDALRQNNNSSGNTAIGRAALYYTSAENNTALGQNSLFNVGAGKSNTAVGQSSGNNIVQGSNNLVLGYNAQATANNVSNEITLGNSLMNHLRVPGIGVSFSEGGAVISGIVTATSFQGDGSALTGIAADKIFEGNTEAEVVDTGSDGHFKVTTEGSERFRIASDGKIGINTTPSHSFEIFTGTDHENIIQVKGTNSAGVYAGMGVYQGNAIFTGGGIGSNSAGMIFRTAASGSEAERLRITSTGVVGITTDASGNGGGAKLVVGGRVQSNNGGYWFADANGAENGWHVQDSGGNLLIVESGVAERLRIGSSGQIGLGGANYGSSGQVLTSNGSGSAASWTTVSGTTINNNADNRLITGSGTANTLEGEANVTYEGHTFTTGLTGITPKFVLKRTGNVDSADNIFSTLQTHDANGTSVAEITVRRESANDEAYMDFETRATGQNVQGSVRIKGSNGTMYCAGNLGRANNNQPAYFNDQVLGGTTVPSVLSLRTLTNGGETGLLIRGTSQGGGSSSPHSCIRVDATACGNNADQYGIYLRGQQQLVSDTTGYYADVYGSYSTTYCFRAHLQKQVGAYTTGTSFHSKITQTSSGGSSYHFRGYNGSSERIRIDLGGNVTNTNNSYGSLSDVKLKENIVDANSQWDDIKALKVRNFNFIDDPDKVKMLGLVAQEAESVSAGLVETNNDIEVDESTGEGKVTGTTKYLKYSILYMKAIKALQEAQTRIETLESKVTALEGS
tara:strand:- start:2860 stop:5553 length:2694 start_codon:yes stop_codon:yes gene_type:complete